MSEYALNMTGMQKLIAAEHSCTSSTLNGTVGAVWVTGASSTMRKDSEE